jgi:hypothetical protein
VSETDEWRPDPRRWRALSVTLTAGFMSLLDVSIVAVALPSMREGLGVSPTAIQWVVSGTLPALFYLVLASTGNDYRAAVAAALAAAVVGVAAALVIAVVDWRREVHRERDDAAEQPAEQHA